MPLTSVSNVIYLPLVVAHAPRNRTVRRPLKNELASRGASSQISQKAKEIIRRAVAAGPVSTVTSDYEEFAEFRDPMTGTTVQLHTVEFRVGKEYCVVEDVLTARQRSAMYAAIEEAKGV